MKTYGEDISGKGRFHGMQAEGKTARDLGAEGERRAVALYREWGYAILARNDAFSGLGELDFVAQRGSLLAFVEVRTRGSDSGGHPLETVTTSKRARILRSARLYWERADDELRSRIEEIRFDVVSVQEKPFGWVITPVFGAFEGHDVW